MNQPVTTPPDLNELRQRILSGGQYSKEELRAAVMALRTNRAVPAEKSVATRTRKAAAKTAATPMSDADLDASLKQLGLDL